LGFLAAARLADFEDDGGGVFIIRRTASSKLNPGTRRSIAFGMAF